MGAGGQIFFDRLDSLATVIAPFQLKQRLLQFQLNESRYANLCFGSMQSWVGSKVRRGTWLSAQTVAYLSVLLPTNCPVRLAESAFSPK